MATPIGSVSSQNCCKGFHFKEKVEKQTLTYTLNVIISPAPNPTPNPTAIPNRNPNLTVSLTPSQPDAHAKNYLAIAHNYYSTKTRPASRRQIHNKS